MPMAACSVLLSLALEVYLKLLALLGSHEGHLKGHNYVELFGDLDGDDQAALQTGWEAFTRATSGWAETLAEVRRQHPDLVLAEDFTAMLEENARAFEEWRYCHELAGLKSLPWTAQPLVEIARKLILRKQPDLTPLAAHLHGGGTTLLVRGVGPRPAPPSR